MNLFLSAVGVIIFLLVILSAFNYGRQLEADFCKRAEEFAKAAVAEYHSHLISSYYAAESQRRWMMQCPTPQLPAIPDHEQSRRRRSEAYNPADNPEFAARFQSNGQATMLYNNREGRIS